MNARVSTDRPAALGGLVVAVAGVTVVLHAAGSAGLGAPPLARPAQWAAWVSGRDPLLTVMALVRLVGLAVAWYLLVTTVLGLAVRLLPAPRLVPLANRFTLPAVRRLLVSAAGVTLASGVSPSLALPPGLQLPAAVARPAPSQAAAAGHLQTPPPTTTAAPASPDPGQPPPTLTMRLLPPDGSPPREASPRRPPEPSAPGPGRESWQVRPGECFWSIAEDVLVRARGRPVSDAEVVAYWRTLIEANRDALVDRANPDLVFPGQVFSVPPVPQG